MRTTFVAALLGAFASAQLFDNQAGISATLSANAYCMKNSLWGLGLKGAAQGFVTT